VPEQTAVIAPAARPWYARLFGSPRTAILAVAGVLIIGGAAVFAITQIGADEDPTPAADRAPNGSGASGAVNEDEDDGDDGRQRAAIDPSTVTVAVLNGTTVPGLAAEVGDRVETFGFVLGTVANSSDQQLAESVVQYTQGHERDALAVGRRLKISQRTPVDPSTQELAGDATVVVIVGGDRS
jgi:hypothetical protein